MELSYVLFKTIDINDPFFESLKASYAEFSEWFVRKSEDYAYVFRSSEGRLDGFLYLKMEEGPVSDIEPPLPSKRRLKVGTMKINPHGTRLGERFVKKIFDHAIYLGLDEIYVTVFSEHETLINLLAEYGFCHEANKLSSNGTEKVLIRRLFDPYVDVVRNYPVVNLKDQNAYVLSLYPKWHTRLLPDSILNNEDAEIVEDVSSSNSIHKVYLASMQGMEVLKRGDVIVIYRTTDNKGPAHYRSVATSLCVLEDYRDIRSFSCWDDFYRYCRPYSVFSRSELEKFWSTKKYHHVIRFAYNIAFKSRVTRGTMIEEIGIPHDIYWGFFLSATTS